MANVRDLAGRMMLRFQGYEHAYGTYGSEQKSTTKSGKLEIRSSARTVKDVVTIDMWVDHIEGRKPLGIIPINEKNECKWSCIDVDSYTINHTEIVEKLAKRKLPMIVARSKSGGAHIFVFFKQWTSARDIQPVLKNLSAALGLGNCEIFPKQTEVLLERGDFGSWLNMPYMDVNKTKRAGVKATGALMTLEEFLDLADQYVCDLSDLELKDGAASDEFKDGPPCLQHLTKQGFPEGTRNNGLTALSIFAKKKYEASWKEKVEEWNRLYMDPPLTADEVKNITRSMERKDYKYSCKTTPLCDHCNSRVCISRKYGVGQDGDFPILSGMTVMNTDPPLWFIDVADHRLMLTTDELMMYSKFHKVCMEKLLVVYPLLKQQTWTLIVKEAMEGVIVVEAPPEVSKTGVLEEMLEEFCQDRSQTQNKDEILLGRVWESEEDNRYYFRLRDVMDYLIRMRFDKEVARNWVSEQIKNFGGGPKFFVIQGRGTNVWYLPRDFAKHGEVELPAHPPETI